MSQMIHNIEDRELLSDQNGRQLNNEGNGGSASGIILKKGPWTSAEDAILVDYVKKHGEGNWNTVQKHSGLSRCGKSCRLRWANHLRPNLKKGAFTTEEERLIAELHAKMGNKWARMAAHRSTLTNELPGRTDNEIKNYWNTRIKRRQRAGLPLYPPEVCLQESKECQQGRSAAGKIGDRGHDDFLQENSYQNHDTLFDSLNASQGGFPNVPEIPDICANNILLKGLGSSQHCNFLPSTLPYHKRFHDSTMPFLSSSEVINGFYPLHHIQHYTYDKIAQSFGYNSPLDPGPSSQNPLCYSHLLSNGKSSTSKPNFEALKLELPSLQYPETDLGSWGTSPPPPLLESVDVLAGTPLPTSLLGSESSSPYNSGLLDALLDQSKNLSSSKNHCSNNSSNSSTATPGDRADSSILYVYETACEDYADCVSTFGATSILNESLAVSANENSFDELKPAQTLNENTLKSESAYQTVTPISEDQDMSMLDIHQLDVLLASDLYEQGPGFTSNEAGANNSIATLSGSDDLATDYKYISKEISSPSQVWGLDSCIWNNMPAVCQMSDLP